MPGAGALAVWPSDATAAPLFAQGPKDTDGRPTAPHNPQHLNRYSYVLNNPVRYTDPSGHWTFSISLSFRAGAFVGGSYSFGLIIDGHGNSKVLDTYSGGATIGAGLSASIAGTATTADNIYQTAGSGTQIGIGGGYLGSVSVDVINPGADLTKKNQYAGVSVGIGISPPLPLAEWHLESTETTLYAKWGKQPRRNRDLCPSSVGYCGDSGVPNPPPKPVSTPVPQK